MLKVVEKEPESEEESEEEESGGNKCLTAHATVCVIVWPARTHTFAARADLPQRGMGCMSVFDF